MAQTMVAMLHRRTHAQRLWDTSWTGSSVGECRTEEYTTGQISWTTLERHKIVEKGPRKSLYVCFLVFLQGCLHADFFQRIMRVSDFV